MPSTTPTSGTLASRLAIEPDAHGQAALLLNESLLHTLVAKAVITNAEAIEVIECAASVKHEVAAALGESNTTMQASLSLLSRMASSFRADEDS